MANKTITHTAVLAATVATAALVMPATASAAGACGGGMNFNQVYAGWQARGVLDDVYREAGITPGVDAAKGSASKALLRKALVLKKVVKGTSSARNTTCSGNAFVGIDAHARQPSGSYVWVFKDDISSTGKVEDWWAADCGNDRGGIITVSVSTKKPTSEWVKSYLEKQVTGLPYGGSFDFQVRGKLKSGKTNSKTKTVTKTVSVAPGLRTYIGTFKKGTKVTVTEKPLPGWTPVGSFTQSKKASGGSLKFKFVNTRVTCGDTNSCPKPLETDLCVNIEGNQITIPNGMILVSGNCSVQTQEQNQDCPSGEIGDSQINKCQQQQQQCKADEVRDANGVCVNQQQQAQLNCSKAGGTYSAQDRSCTLIQVQGNCSFQIVITGDGNTINLGPVGVCVTSPPATTPPTTPPVPKCPDGRPVPSTGCDRAPELKTLEPAHVMVGGTTFAYARAWDADGDVVDVNITMPANPYAHVSGETEQVSTYLSEGALIQCPSGWTCFRKRVWGDAVGTAPLRASVTANGVSGTPVEGSLKVEPDSGF